MNCSHLQLSGDIHQGHSTVLKACKVPHEGFGDSVTVVGPSEPVGVDSDDLCCSTPVLTRRRYWVEVESADMASTSLRKRAATWMGR